MFEGGYPAPLDRGIAVTDWLANYIESLVERDIRSLINVSNLDRFRVFVRLCAARVGKVLNLAGLAADCGIAAGTARQWLSALDTSYITYRLPPFHANIGKRLVKAPKLYFYDTGLAAHLLGVRTGASLATHAQRGTLFENLVVSERLKYDFHQGRRPDLHFYRDHGGREIDLLIGSSAGTLLVEAKSGTTIHHELIAETSRTCGAVEGLIRMPIAGRTLVTGGDESMTRQGISVVGWRKWPGEVSSTS